jgi:hypothetical protein
MIGESIGTADLLKSFLWNWIALEMLLTRQDDKVEEMLPKRAEALLGWARTSVNPDMTLWQAREYDARIRRVYKKRNALVHRGQRNAITHEDVEFTDHLLLNLLGNLVAFPELFPSKQALVEFSEKVEAERILKVKPRVRPRDLKFIGNLPGPAPRVEIEYRIGEWRNLPQEWREDAQSYDGGLGPEANGCYFRVSNTGKGSARVRDAYVKDGGARIMSAESTWPDLRWLHPGESAIFFVPGRELARALLERGHRSSGWATFEMRESLAKPHRKSFEVPDLESRVAL